MMINLIDLHFEWETQYSTYLMRAADNMRDIFLWRFETPKPIKSDSQPMRGMLELV